MNLKRNIIIGVTGGIAAYKSPVLVRRLKEKGAEVKVVMTNGASHFITPLTLQAVSGQPVRNSLLDADAESGMDHIALARWADTVIIAPASADFIAKLAHGFADDLLTTLCLATSATIYVAPAMNQQMWNNPATQQNIAKIRQNGIHLLGPDEGDQACGETGPGRMLDPLAIIESIFDHTSAISNKDSIESSTQSQAIQTNSPVSEKSDTRPDGAPAKQKTLRVLVTAGPTWEALDPVRGLTNHSSGKMGYSIARAFTTAGYPTTLISGPTAITAPAETACIQVVSAQQMHDAVHRNIDETDIFISVAAIADYRPDVSQPNKIKKSHNTMQITLIRNPDILKSVTSKPNHPFTIGFAAETDNVLEYAKSKLKNKNLDMIIANEVGNGKAFGQSTNELTVISQQNQLSLGPDSKDNLAKQLVTIISEEYENRHSAKST
jgi:phosphopantothenoylcysteine decarboxylase/phosphopantothenate--cysteine ligase